MCCILHYRTVYFENFVKMLLSLSVVVLALVAIGAGENEKCAWGESYWCSDLRAAKACGAVQHCKTTVWKNQEMPKDVTAVCTFCRSIVNDVHTFIADKRTEVEIAEFLASACRIIPREAAANECIALVEQYTPEIIELVVAELEPQVVCGLLKLCSGLEDKVLHYEISSQGLHHVPLLKDEVSAVQNDIPICTDCKKFLQDIQDLFVSGDVQTWLEKQIDTHVCSLLGDLKDECNEIVKLVLPTILNYTAALDDPQAICTLLEMCNGSKVDIKVMFQKLAMISSTPVCKTSSVEGCVMCKTVLTELQALDRNVQIQNDLKNFLKTDVCALISSLKDSCTQLIDRFAPTVFEFLATILDPDTRCRSFGFCAATEVQEVPKPTVRISEECILCEFVMKEIDQMLAKNATEQEIIDALDKVCSILPKTIAVECKDFVDTYGPAIIELLKVELDPAKVCTILGLCKSSLSLPQKPKVGDDETCLICETLVQYVEALISENATLAEIEALLDKACNFLPESMRKDCNSIIAEYAEAIVEYIKQQYSPKEVCTLIKLCSSNRQQNSVHMANLLPAKARRVGVKECTYGPSYWCASQENAEKCGAVNHCKKYVWKN